MIFLIVSSCVSLSVSMYWANTADYIPVGYNIIGGQTTKIIIEVT
jgi:hypothetical protein